MMLGKECENIGLMMTTCLFLAEYFFCCKASFEWEIHTPPLHPAEPVDFTSLLIPRISTASYLAAVIRMVLTIWWLLLLFQVEGSMLQAILLKSCCTQMINQVVLEQDAQELSIYQNVFRVHNVSPFQSKPSAGNKTFAFSNCAVMYTVNLGLYW